MTTGKTIALTRQTFVGKVMSLLLNTLSRLVITFLPRSKCLLISWLQSPSAVILDAVTLTVWITINCGKFWNHSACMLPRSHTLGPGKSPGQGTGSPIHGDGFLVPPSGTSSFPITLLHHFWWGRRKIYKTLSLLPTVKLWGFKGLLQLWITLI